MIYGTFEDAQNYFQAGSPIHRALSFALTFDPSGPDGRYEIEDGKIYALVSSYWTSPAGELKFEAHRKYADVQVVLEGEEKIEVSLTRNLAPVEEYSETNDKVLLEPPLDTASLVMKPGYFAVLYPLEVHRPSCDLHGKRHVRKIVVKVSIH
ncbi:MAG: YhcH/YjgK/YiaL family protein [Syntrophobacteraceae bacterium]|jgi:YhcH/YjgK/YiaL family protein